MRRIGIDFDGVMCDMLTPLVLLYNEEHGTKLTVDDITEWKLPEGSFKIFSETKGFFRNLEPIKGAIEAVNKLSNLYEVVFVTCAANVPQVAHDKMAWWIDHNLTHIPLMITGKKYLLDIDILVDDAPHHVEEFVNSSPSKIAILPDAFYNRNVKTGDKHRVHRAMDWEDIVRLCQTKV